VGRLAWSSPPNLPDTPIVTDSSNKSASESGR
jgi:hypothetical protein